MSEHSDIRGETYKFLALVNLNPLSRTLEAEDCFETLELLEEPAKSITEERNRFSKNLLRQLMETRGEENAIRYFGQQEFDAIRALP